MLVTCPTFAFSDDFVINVCFYQFMRTYLLLLFKPKQLANSQSINLFYSHSNKLDTFAPDYNNSYLSACQFLRLISLNPYSLLLCKCTTHYIQKQIYVLLFALTYANLESF